MAMADLHSAWREEDGGDWELKVDDAYFGIIRPHRCHRRQCWRIAWDWGLKVNYSWTSLDHAKSLLERSARAAKAAAVAPNAVLDAEGAEERADGRFEEARTTNRDHP